MDGDDLFDLDDFFERFSVAFALERFDADLLEVDAHGRQGAPEAILSSHQFGMVAVEATTIAEQASLLVDNELQRIRIPTDVLTRSWQVWLGGPLDDVKAAGVRIAALIQHAEAMGIYQSSRLPDPPWPELAEWRRSTRIKFAAFSSTAPHGVYLAPPTVTAWEPGADPVNTWLETAEWDICVKKAAKLQRTGADRQMLALRIDRSGVPDGRTWISVATPDCEPLTCPPPVPDTVTDVLIAALPSVVHYWQRAAGWSAVNCSKIAAMTHTPPAG